MFCKQIAGRAHSRCEDRICALIVEVELIKAIGKCKQDQAEDEKELEDVEQHAAQRDLQRPQVGVGREESDEPQRAEDVGDSEEGLGHQGGVQHVPRLPLLHVVVLEGDSGNY